MDAPRLTIVGIAGFARSGKDTLADYFCMDHGFAKTHFADSFKKHAQEIFDFTDAQLWGSDKEKPDVRYRYSGICPRDRAHCTEQQDGNWRCPTCGNTYNKFLTARLALQTISTEWGRTMYPSVWTDYTLRFIRESAEREQKMRWVIADIRMLEEVQQVKAIGGIVVRIKRNMPHHHLWHATESELTAMPDSLFHAVISNDGTLDELHQKTNALVHEIL